MLKLWHCCQAFRSKMVCYAPDIMVLSNPLGFRAYADFIMSFSCIQRKVSVFHLQREHKKFDMMWDDLQFCHSWYWVDETQAVTDMRSAENNSFPTRYPLCIICWFIYIVSTHLITASEQSIPPNLNWTQIFCFLYLSSLSLNLVLLRKAYGDCTYHILPSIITGDSDTHYSSTDLFACILLFRV